MRILLHGKDTKAKFNAIHHEYIISVKKCVVIMLELRMREIY